MKWFFSKSAKRIEETTDFRWSNDLVRALLNLFGIYSYKIVVIYLRILYLNIKMKKISIVTLSKLLKWFIEYYGTWYFLLWVEKFFTFLTQLTARLSRIKFFLPFDPRQCWWEENLNRIMQNVEKWNLDTEFISYN